MTNIISAFVAIDDADQSNGCLQVAPGMHRFGMLGKHMEPIPDEKILEMEFIDINLSAGDCLLFDGYLPHRSHPNLSNRSRRTLLLSYNNKEEGDFRSLFVSGK